VLISFFSSDDEQERTHRGILDKNQATGLIVIHVSSMGGRQSSFSDHRRFSLLLGGATAGRGAEQQWSSTR